MRSDGDAWEDGEEGDAGKEDRLRNIRKHIPRGDCPALPQSSNKTLQTCKFQRELTDQRYAKYVSTPPPPFIYSTNLSHRRSHNPIARPFSSSSNVEYYITIRPPHANSTCQLTRILSLAISPSSINPVTSLATSTYSQS
jgi:hypothetical protein